MEQSPLSSGWGAAGDRVARDSSRVPSAIAARALGKCFRIFPRPGDRVRHLLWPRAGGAFTEFWALRDVSLDVRPGRMLGVIGRNGAGKSTLLQILAGVLKPTAGEAVLRGRRAAILSLGCGFDGACTGRENVVLSGQIMGLPRGAILEQLGTIRDFADLGDFFDRPVGLYSSGMVSRLAFAIAAHLPAETLLLDEVLSVGDIAFQRKCYERLCKIRDGGATIVLATHDTNIVRVLCDEALMLEQGRVAAAGDPARVVDAYVALLLGGERGTAAASLKARRQDFAAVGPASVETLERSFEPAFLARVPARQRLSAGASGPILGDRKVEVEAGMVLGAGGEPLAAIHVGAVCTVRTLLRFRESAGDFCFGVLIRDRLGQDIFGQTVNSAELGLCGPFRPGERVAVDFRFRCDLRQDTYFVSLGVGNGAQSAVHYYGSDLMELRLEPAGELVYGVANLPYEFGGCGLEHRSGFPSPGADVHEGCTG